MAIEMILLDDVAGLGKVGDKVRVSDGYARNYLLPRKKAEIMNKATARRVEAIKLRMQKEHEERVAVAQAMADKMAGTVITIPMAVGENNKLFGSVSTLMIAEELVKLGFEIDKNAIVLDENLHELGEFDVNVKLHQEVTAAIKVVIAAKSAE